MSTFFRRIGQALGLAAAATALVGAPSVHASDTGWRANPDDALLFETHLGRFRLGDGVRGYQTPTGTCVDLADVALALDLPLRIDKQSRRATGWAFDERHGITIDRVSSQEQIMNNIRKVAPDDIHDTPEGWCVSTTALSRWLGVSVEADLSNALLVITSDHKLPPELLAERRARVAPTAVSFDLASLPHASTPYRGVRAPSVDVVASLGGLRDRQAGNRIDAQYEFYAAGEVGPVAYDARLASDRSGVPATLRVRAYRTDPAGGLLGPLHATQVAAGDVSGYSTPLVAQSGAGRGAMITNRPVDRPDGFDKTDFRGELPRGWDAELYRNGQLLGFANDRADGRYEFLSVPLLYGQNRFEVVLYGPQGQIRREVKSVPVGLDSIPPRKTFYWAGVSDEGHDLVNLVPMPTVFRRGWRGTLGVERGLNAKTSFAAWLHTLMLEGGGRRSYAEVALRRALGPALAEVSAAKGFQGGAALRAQVLAEAGNTHLGVETIWATGGFESDRILKDVTGLYSVTADHFFGTGRTTIPVHIDARLTTRATGDMSIDLASRVSSNIGRIVLSGELGWHATRRRYGPNPADAVDIGLLGSGRIGHVRLRGEARFRVSPDSQFQSATLVGEWSAGQGVTRTNDWRAEIGYDQALSRGRVGLGYIARFDRFAVTATGEAATDGSVAAGVNLAFSLGSDPRRQGGIRMSSEKLAQRGTTLVRVYRDTNANGRRDPGEPLEKDVMVSAGRVPVDRATDANGEVIVDGLEPFQPVLIGVDSSSLPDPFVQPATSGLVVTPRPGMAMAIDLPLVSAGDVDGTLVRSGGGSLEGVDLELVDGEGHAVARARSDFDGFFLFESIPYGRYTVRIAPMVADAIKLDSALVGVALVGAANPSVHLGAVAARARIQRAAM